MSVAYLASLPSPSQSNVCCDHCDAEYPSDRRLSKLCPCCITVTQVESSPVYHPADWHHAGDGADILAEQATLVPLLMIHGGLHISMSHVEYSDVLLECDHQISDLHTAISWPPINSIQLTLAQFGVVFRVSAVRPLTVNFLIHAIWCILHSDLDGHKIDKIRFETNANNGTYSKSRTLKDRLGAIIGSSPRTKLIDLIDGSGHFVGLTPIPNVLNQWLMTFD